MTPQTKRSVQMDFDRDAVLSAFLAETDEGLTAMEQALIALESGSAEPDLLHDIFRVAHTIKGNAAALELGPLVTFAHQVEDLLDSLRSQELAVSEDVISLLLATVDELRMLVPAAAAGASALTERQNKLKSDIEALVRGSENSSSPTLFQTAIPQQVISNSATANSTARRTLRADISRLDDILNLTGEIASPTAGCA